MPSGLPCRSKISAIHFLAQTQCVVPALSPFRPCPAIPLLPTLLLLLDPQRQGCLLIFFTNFLALTIKAGVASPDSSGSSTYAVVLVIANACFFLAAFSNTWFLAKDAMAKRHVTVRARSCVPAKLRIVSTAESVVLFQLDGSMCMSCDAQAVGTGGSPTGGVYFSSEITPPVGKSTTPRGDFFSPPITGGWGVYPEGICSK